jgi:hypothetical protein
MRKKKKIAICGPHARRSFPGPHSALGIPEEKWVKIESEEEGDWPFEDVPLFLKQRKRVDGKMNLNR